MLLAGCIAPQDAATDERTGDDPGSGSEAPSGACPGHGASETGAGAQQSGVSNQPGSFSYSGQFAAKTGKEVYLWQNPSSGAYVQWGGQSAAGSVGLRVQDACGDEVYGKQYGGAQQTGAQEATGRGVPGEWALTFEFSSYTGQMGLQITSG